MTVGKSLVEDMARAMHKARCEHIGLRHLHNPDEPAELSDRIEAEACLSVLKDRLPADDRELVLGEFGVFAYAIAAVRGANDEGKVKAFVELRDRIIAYSASRDECASCGKPLSRDCRQCQKDWAS